MAYNITGILKSTGQRTNSAGACVACGTTSQPIHLGLLPPSSARWGDTTPSPSRTCPAPAPAPSCCGTGRGTAAAGTSCAPGCATSRPHGAVRRGLLQRWPGGTMQPWRERGSNGGVAQVRERRASREDRAMQPRGGGGGDGQAVPGSPFWGRG